MWEKLEHQMVTLTDAVTDIGVRVGKTEESIVRIDKHLVRIDEHLVRIDDHFVLIDKKFDLVNERFEKVDQHFDKMDLRFDKMDARFNAVESQLAVIQSNYMTKDIFHIYITKQTHWIMGMMVALAGVVFTAARYIH